ncbi:MAG: hypothetical protein ACLFP0_09210 [Rhodosalinus sp.]
MSWTGRPGVFDEGVAGRALRMALRDGPLRPAHLLSLHAVQALPLTALRLDRRRAGALPLARARALDATFTRAGFVQALTGLPPNRA